MRYARVSPEAVTLWGTAPGLTGIRLVRFGREKGALNLLGLLLTLRAAYGKDQGRPVMLEASMAKVFASEVGMKCATKAVQIHGGYGYTREFPVERFFRDVKLCEIGEGTSEVQRMVIAHHLLQAG